MSIIPESSIEEVRSLSDVVDVVGEYVQLKKRGSNFVGLCPFHSEKTPSFNVNPRMGIFKCFGCGEGGDVFSFISRIEALSFPEAVRVLAEKSGVVLPQEEAPSEDASESESIYHALRFAARFFHEALAKDDRAEAARKYLLNRGFELDSIKKFGIGYAPDSWDALFVKATEQHIDAEYLEGAGLIIRKKDGVGYYDRYRHRLIFPIFSHVGKVVGFGGRVLREDDEPKYINSPETKVYNKSRILYGLYNAKNAIRAKEEAILVEGYTDVVSLNQAGVEHVIASSGTALTRDQIGAVSRYARTIVLLYDADQAGLRAALRGIDLILEEGLIPYAVRLPDGEDPDSYVNEHGGAKFEEYLRSNRQNFVEFVLTNSRSAGSMDTPEGIATVQRTILQSVARIKDSLIREAYLKEASSKLDIPDMQLRPILEGYIKGDSRRTEGKSRREARKRGRSEMESGNKEVDVKKTRQPMPSEKKLLRLMLGEGSDMIEWIMTRLPLSDFTEGPVREMAGVLVDQYKNQAFNRKVFFGPGSNREVQALAAEVMTIAFEPSENWQRRKKIKVPRLDENATEAAASAMVYLRTVRIDDQIMDLKQQMLRLQQAGGDVVNLQKNMMKLLQYKQDIRERKFLE